MLTECRTSCDSCYLLYSSAMPDSFQSDTDATFFRPNCIQRRSRICSLLSLCKLWMFFLNIISFNPNSKYDMWNHFISKLARCRPTGGRIFLSAGRRPKHPRWPLAGRPACALAGPQCGACCFGRLRAETVSITTMPGSLSSSFLLPWCSRFLSLSSSKNLLPTSIDS